MRQPKFQFHDGTIDSRYCWSHMEVLFRFQFHDGTIDSRFAGHTWKFYSDFNSTMVRLIGRYS